MIRRRLFPRALPGLTALPVLTALSIAVLLLIAPACGGKREARAHGTEEAPVPAAPTPDNTPIDVLRTPAGRVLKTDESVTPPAATPAPPTPVPADGAPPKGTPGA
jgi:hypothetical protein